MTIARRKVCTGCHFLETQCVCSWIPSLSTSLKVMVIQDPKEAKHAKNTVSLLRLAIPTVECVAYEPIALNKRLSELTLERWRLVFPNEASEPIETSTHKDQSSSIEGIILIDATWRKAKRLFLTTPVLHAMSSWHFNDSPKGDYAIRKSPGDKALSTLEACAYVIEQVTQSDMQLLREFMISAQSFQWRQQPDEHKYY